MGTVNPACPFDKPWSDCMAYFEGQVPRCHLLDCPGPNHVITSSLSERDIKQLKDNWERMYTNRKPSVMKIKIVSVKCFEVFSEDGHSHGLYTAGDQWRGLCELQRVGEKKETVIVDTPETLFEAIFGEIRKEVHVVKASSEFFNRVSK